MVVPEQERTRGSGSEQQNGSTCDKCGQQQASSTMSTMSTMPEMPSTFSLWSCVGKDSGTKMYEQKPHHPLVRNQSSRVVLLDQNGPKSPESVTTEEFRMPQPYRRPIHSSCRRICIKVSCLVCLAIIIFGSTLLSLVAFDCVFPTSDVLEHERKTKSKVCKSPPCMSAASRLLDRLDPATDPCTDFYRFACGNYLDTNEIPDDSFHRSTLQEMQEKVLVAIKKLIEEPSTDHENVAVRKARKLYVSCMDQSFRTSHYQDYQQLPIFSVLTKEGIGHWPILGRIEEWNQSEYRLERLLAQLAIHQVHNLFDIYVTPDERNNSKYMLQFYKGEPAMAKAYYLNDSNPDYVRYLRSYRRLLLESVLLLTQGNNHHAVDEVDDILRFETQFANLTESAKCYSPVVNGTEEDDDNGRMMVQDIQHYIPDLDWVFLLNYAFDSFSIDMDVPEMVITLHCKEFFPELLALIDRTPPRTITNYLIWRFVFRYMPFLGNKFLLNWIEFMKDVPDTNEEKLYLSRWKQCASIVNDGLGMAVAHLYVEKFHDNETETKILEMIHYLKNAFREIIEKEEWVDEEMKREIEEKLDSMGYKIGYPQYILDPVALEEEYEGLEISDGNFLQNILKLRKHEVWKELSKLTRSVDKAKDWLIQPLVVNAFHNPSTNEIIIPLGILRNPIYNVDYPMYLNFANLGVVIGHEITHGYDNHALAARRYDSHGNMTQRWSDEMMVAFREKAVCYVDQYGEFNMPMVGKKVDGNNTLSDNICDNAGLRHSWLAYKAWERDHGPEPLLPGLNFTVDEIFFITYGQIWCEVLNKEGYEQYSRDLHSPGRYRTMGVLQNNQDFSETFHCETGSVMNPEKKCHLWT